MMHSIFYGEWLCGPGGFFPGFHFGGVFRFALLGIFSLLIFKTISHLFPWSRSKGSYAHNVSSSMTILEERYAAGEIDKEEFMQKRKDLNG